MGYIDPGALGIIAQIGYVLLFTVVSAFLFLSRPIRKAVNRLFHRSAPAESDTDTGPRGDAQ